jgi:polysaccharide pyruvyl transferase WcaK-like protein
MKNISLQNILKGFRDRISEIATVSRRDLRHVGKFFNGKPLILYSGWVGYGNLGDELLFSAHEKLFAEHNLIPYHRMSLLNILIRLNRKNVKGCFLGGGTLINLPGAWLKDTKRMLAMDVPVFALGTGVNFKLTEDNERPVVNDSIRSWIGPLEQFRYLGVRGPLSAEVLDARLEKSTEVVGDTALSLAPDMYAVPEKDNMIGICVGYGKDISPVFDADTYRAIFSTFIKEHISQGFEVTLLPVVRNDEAFNQELLEDVNDIRCSVINFRGEQEEYFSGVAACTLFIGQKLHSTVTATMLRVPSVMISYHAKCVDYMYSIGMEDQIIFMKDLSVRTLTEKSRHTLEHGDELRPRLDAAIVGYSTIQKERARQIKSSLAK